MDLFPQFGVIGCQSIQLAMKTCLNSDALESIEEDELIKEDEEEEDDLVSEGDKFEITEDYNEIEDDDDEEDGDHERAADLKFNHCNDTTQVVEEDEYDESAYVTSVGSNTKVSFSPHLLCLYLVVRLFILPSIESLSYSERTIHVCQIGACPLPNPQPPLRPP